MYLCICVFIKVNFKLISLFCVVLEVYERLIVTIMRVRVSGQTGTSCTFFSGLSTSCHWLFLICCSSSNLAVTSSMESCKRSQNPARSWDVGLGMALGSWEETTSTIFCVVFIFLFSAFLWNDFLFLLFAWYHQSLNFYISSQSFMTAQLTTQSHLSFWTSSFQPLGGSTAQTLLHNWEHPSSAKHVLYSSKQLL